MALVLNPVDIGKKFKIVRVGYGGEVEGPGVEVYRWYLAAIGPNAQGNIIYSFKKDPNDNEDQWVKLPKSFFDNGFALISHDNAMNLDGGKRRKRRRYSKTKRAHKTKRRRSRR
jgi:hypothetical protein